MLLLPTINFVKMVRRADETKVETSARLFEFS